MVYYEQPPDDADKPPGCLDALFITRAVFGVLLVPILLIMSVVGDIALAFLLYGIHPALGLIPIGVTLAAVWAYARWEQHKYRPPGV